METIGTFSTLQPKTGQTDSYTRNLDQGSIHTVGQNPGFGPFEDRPKPMKQRSQSGVRLGALGIRSGMQLHQLPGCKTKHNNKVQKAANNIQMRPGSRG